MKKKNNLIKSVFFVFGIIFLFASVLIPALHAQDTIYARRVLNELTHKKYHGRGYEFKGDSLAAAYISQQMKEIGLKTWYENYQQTYCQPINVREGKAIVDFGKSCSYKTQSEAITIDPMSRFTKGKYEIINAKNVKITDIEKDYSNKFICIDFTEITDEHIRNEYNRMIFQNDLKAAGYIAVVKNHRTYSMVNATKKYSSCLIYVVKDSLKAPLSTIKINLDARFIDDYTAQNVVGYVKGKENNDQWIVIGAHYDHLGSVGKKYFYPGAQDNAAGTAFVLDLARYFKEHQPKKNIVFITFDNEEAGLLGSDFFVKNCPINKKNIKMMINLDLVGNGEEGFTIVGAEDYPEIKDIILLNNGEKQYHSDIRCEGTAPNSDHYSFHKAGIPAIFLYTRGVSGGGHSPEDLPQYLSFKGYHGLFRLIVDLIEY